MGCGVASPTPDAAADVAIDAPRDAAIMDDTPDTEVSSPPDRPEAPHDAVADAVEEAPVDAGATDGGDDATTLDVEVVLPAEDAGGAEDVTPDMDVVLPAEDATSDMDVAIPLEDVAPDTGVGSPADDAVTDLDQGSPTDIAVDVAPVVDAPAVDSCVGCCTQDDQCDALYRCVERRCEPRWNACQGAPLPLDGTAIRVDPSTLRPPGASIPNTNCGPPLPTRVAAVFNFTLPSISDVQIRATGLPPGARVQVRNRCELSAISYGECGAGGYDARLRAMVAAMWLVIVEAPDITEPFEVSATRLPRSVPDADRCPGVEIVPDTSGVTLFPVTYAAMTDVPGQSCSGSVDSVDWAAHFTLTETRDVTLHASSSFTSLSRSGMILSTSCRVRSAQACNAEVYRAVPPGEYWVVGSQRTPSPSMQLSVSTAPPNTGRVPGDVCSTARAVTLDGAVDTVDLAPLDRWVDLGASCSAAGRGEYGLPDAVWRFSLAERSDVRLSVSAGFATELHSGCGVDAPRVGPCAIAREARSVWYTDVPPGDYSVVSARSPELYATAASVSLAVLATPHPRARVTGDTCEAPLTLPLDGTEVAVTPTSLDPTLDLGTLASRADLSRSWTDAVWRFSLARRSDVTLAFSATTPELSWQVQARCGVGEGVRVGNWSEPSRTLRALAPGDYFVVAAWPGAPLGQLSLRATATDAATAMPGDTCATPIDVDVEAGSVSVALRGLAGLEHGPRSLTQTRAILPRMVDAVFRYEHAPDEDLVADISVSTGRVYAEQRARCDDPDSNLGPSMNSVYGASLTLPLRRSADGVGYLIVGADLPAAATLVTATVTLRRATLSAAPTYIASASPAYVRWTDACSLPGATRFLQGATDAFATVSLPFPLRYFGRAYPEGHPIALLSSGVIEFEPNTADPMFLYLPTGPAIVATEALSGRRGQVGAEGVCVAVVGVAPDRRWVITWPSLRTDSRTLARAEVAIHERGTIDALALDAPQYFQELIGLIERVRGAPLWLGVGPWSFLYAPHAAVRFDPIP